MKSRFVLLAVSAVMLAAPFSGAAQAGRLTNLLKSSVFHNADLARRSVLGNGHLLMESLRGNSNLLKCALRPGCGN
jgi:hypothetical protein